MSLLYFANHSGRNMSKLSLVEFEYLLAITVSGHAILKATKIMPSTTKSESPIQTHLSILFVRTAYNK